MKAGVWAALARRPGIGPLTIAAFTVLAVPAQAQIAWESHGYLRAGPGLASRSDNHTCYELPGADFKYRLGNECDLYGEFLFSAAHGPDDGQQFKLNYMPTVFEGAEPNDGKFYASQFYGEAKGLSFAPQASFWIGKRYHRGADIHIVDTYFEKLDGTGLGASVPVLGGKLDLAYYHSDHAGQPVAHRLNAWWRDLPVNEGGSLNVLLGLTRATGPDADGKGGASFSIRHHQKFGDTSDNNLWFQMAQGTAGLDGNFGDLTAGSDVKRWRIVDGYQFQPTTRFGGQAIAMFEQRKSDAGDETVTSLGGRVSYAFTRHFKVLGEVGFDRVKPDGSPERHLTKLTFAPTLSKGEGFMTRPELRLFATRAIWNRAADVAAGDGGLSGLDDGKTSGTSFGLQVETWW
jgi:maltoporin